MDNGATTINLDLIDLKDRKILFELEQDSRQSLSQLAKKVALKKETIFHRIKRLEKQGIIKGYLTEINVYRLGYQFYPVLLRFQNTTPTIEKEVLSYLKNRLYTAWLTTCEGAWDINLTFIAKSNAELGKYLDEFLQKYSKYIAEKEIFVTMEIHYFKRGFWLNKETTQTVSTGGESTVALDEIDLKLLRILSAEARKPLVEIGALLHVNPKTIAYKTKKLEQEKIIQGSHIIVDFSKIGYKFYKIWFSLNDFTPENQKKLMTYLQCYPNIIWATKLIGTYDLSIEMEVQDVEEFRKILDEIKEKFSNLIKKHESLLIFEEMVLNYLPEL